MLGSHQHRVSKMNIHAGKRTMRTTLMFACLLGIASLTLANALNTCPTPECQALADTIQANMDSSVNPCEDFFQYACGNFIKNHPPNTFIITHSTLTAFTAQVQESVYKLLSAPENPEDGRSLNAIKRQFQVCMDDDALETAGLKTLLNIVRQNGDWPMITPDVFPLRKRIQEVQDEYDRLTGRGPLYTVLVYSRTVDSTDNAITFDQPLQYPKKKYNISDPVKAQKFVKYIADVGSEFAKAAGVRIPKERLNSDAQDIFDFMTKLNALRHPIKWRKRGPSMKISEAQAAIVNGTNSSFDLLAAIQTLYRDILSVTITKDEEINVRELEYMQGLLKLLSQTSPIVVLNYMHFHFVEHYLPITTRAMRKLAEDVYDNKDDTRIMRCSLLPNVQIALGRLYAKEYVTENQKIAVEEVLTDLKAQVRIQIERSSFLDNFTRTGALAKLDKLVSIMGNTKLFDSDDAVDEYYSKYKTGDDLVENILSYAGVQYRKQLSELREKVNYTAVSSRFQMSPALVGWYYSSRPNRIALPGAIFQPPLFSLDYPDLSNYAGIGQLIGLSLADLYIFLGLHVNADGGFAAWVSPSVFKELESRDQCFIEQYSNYTVKEFDDVGLYYNTSRHAYRAILARYHFALKTTYMAHKSTVKQYAYRTQLINRTEGLPLTETQIDKQFFLNYANVFCQSINPEKMLEHYNFEGIQHHPTGRIRVNSAMANLPEFSELYGCPIDSPMNPAKKCSTLD